MSDNHIHYTKGPQSVACGQQWWLRTPDKDNITCPDCRLILPFTFIKADKFFPAYAPTVKARKHKLAGLRKLTEADREAIRSGIDKLIADLKSAVIGLIMAFSVM